jgi:hypothetical protein
MSLNSSPKKERMSLPKFLKLFIPLTLLGDEFFKFE